MAFFFCVAVCQGVCAVARTHFFQKRGVVARVKKNEEAEAQRKKGGKATIRTAPTDEMSGAAGGADQGPPPGPSSAPGGAAGPSTGGGPTAATTVVVQEDAQSSAAAAHASAAGGAPGKGMQCPSDSWGSVRWGVLHLCVATIHLDQWRGLGAGPGLKQMQKACGTRTPCAWGRHPARPLLLPLGSVMH